MTKRRRWAERGVLIIAAIASIATSRKKWTLEAKVPPPADATKATFVTVEATMEPRLYMVDRYGNQSSVSPVQPTTWPGHADYFLPAGAHVMNAELTGVCKGGLCSSDCSIPDDARIAITKLTPVEPWSLEDASDPSTVVLDPAKPTPIHVVDIETSREPVYLHVTTTPAGFEPSISGGGKHYDLYWNATNGLAAPVTVTFVVHASIQGACPGPGGCTPPPNSTVRVLGLTRYKDAP